MRENYDVLIFEPGVDDYESEGMCGPLVPTSCKVTEEAGGDYSLEMEHPYDALGRWSCLAAGRLLRAWVSMRTPPELDGTTYVTSLEKWRVERTATKAQRTLWSASTNGKSKKVLKGGTEVVVLSRPAEGRYKVQTAYGKGWMESAGLTFEIAVVVPEGAGGIEAALPGVQIRPQLFEIYSVERGAEAVTVNARHISYQLLKNVTTWGSAGSVTLQAALNGVLSNCLDPHDFTAQTDIADTRVGCNWQRWNPISCFMDPDEGVLKKWGCQLLRDDYDLYFLQSVGVDRGVYIEAGRNMSGITMTESWEGLATYIVPVGEKADGSALLLDNTWLISPHADEYLQRHIYVFDAQDAAVGDDVSEALAKQRMTQQAQALLDGGCDVPQVTVSIEVAQADTEGLAIAEKLEPLPVYDIVHVYDKDRGIEVTERIVKRVWDCIHGRVEEIELGTLSSTMGTGAIASWQVPSGVSGIKIASGSISSGRLSGDVTAQIALAMAGASDAQAAAAAASANASAALSAAQGAAQDATDALNEAQAASAEAAAVAAAVDGAVFRSGTVQLPASGSAALKDLGVISSNGIYKLLLASPGAADAAAGYVVEYTGTGMGAFVLIGTIFEGQDAMAPRVDAYGELTLYGSGVSASVVWRTEKIG